MKMHAPLFLALGLGACVMPATTGPTMPPPASAPVASAAPSSGGATIEAAQPIAHGDTVEGTVVQDGSRYYRIDLQDKESLNLGFYARTPDTFPYALLAVLDRNGGKLAEEMIAVNSNIDWDTDKLDFVAKEPGTYLVRAACSNCDHGQTVAYKIVVK